MSDNHTGLSHDLPEYVPNMPLAADLRRQVRSRIKVYKRAGYWSWRHDCGGRTLSASCLPSQPYALALALKHVKGCR